MTRYFKVKDGQLATLKAWCHLLMSTLKGEAEVTLREENLISESMTLLRHPITQEYFVRGDSVSNGEILPTNLERPINVIHRYILKQCIEPTEQKDDLNELEVLYSINT